MAAAHTGAHTHSITSAVDLRLDQNRPAIDPAETLDSLLERREAFLVVGARIAHEESIGDGMKGKLAPQREIDDSRVEPEAALPIDARVEIKRKSDAVAQGILDSWINRILNPRVQQEHALVDVYIGGAHFKRAIERISPDARCRTGNQRGASENAHPQRVPLNGMWHDCNADWSKCSQVSVVVFSRQA